MQSTAESRCMHAQKKMHAQFCMYKICIFFLFAFKKKVQSCAYRMHEPACAHSCMRVQVNRERMQARMAHRERIQADECKKNLKKKKYRAVRIVNALARFLCCERSSAHLTVTPVGMCVMRTALSVVLTATKNRRKNEKIWGKKCAISRLQRLIRP